MLVSLKLWIPGQQVINFYLITIQLLLLGIYLQSTEYAYNILIAFGLPLW